MDYNSLISVHGGMAFTRTIILCTQSQRFYFTYFFDFLFATVGRDIDSFYTSSMILMNACLGW